MVEVFIKKIEGGQFIQPKLTLPMYLYLAQGMVNGMHTKQPRERGAKAFGCVSLGSKFILRPV